MSFFICILNKLSKKLDKCIALPASSLRRVKAVIKEVDDEEKERILNALHR